MSSRKLKVRYCTVPWKMNSWLPHYLVETLSGCVVEYSDRLLNTVFIPGSAQSLLKTIWLKDFTFYFLEFWMSLKFTWLLPSAPRLSLPRLWTCPRPPPAPRPWSWCWVCRGPSGWWRSSSRRRCSGARRWSCPLGHCHWNLVRGSTENVNWILCDCIGAKYLLRGCHLLEYSWVRPKGREVQNHSTSLPSYPTFSQDKGV